MYEEHFGLKERPFALLPDPAYLYPSHSHDMALSLLRYSLLSEQGFVVITGPVGSGKTTIVNKLLDELGSDVSAGLINYAHTNFGDLPEWVCMSFGLDYKEKSPAELFDVFSRFLVDQYAARRKTVLIVDEAQNMGAEQLEQLRMLTNVNAKKEFLLNLILVGQPELRRILEAPNLRQLTQRISVAHHLEPFNRDETYDYVAYRVRVAGGSADLFSGQALRLIWKESRGVPRLINTLCDLSLVYAFGAKKSRVDGRVVSEVMADRAIFSIRPGEEASNRDSEIKSVDEGSGEVSASRSRH